MPSKAALLALFLGLSISPSFASSPETITGTPVDLELVLAVDISVSMNEDELKVQRDGYIAALTDPAVLQVIKSGPHGQIAVTYFEWAGVTSQHLIVPWTLISNATDAEAVAHQLERLPVWQPRRTSISGALDYGARLLDQSPFNSSRQVIDISGDGANNEGRPVTEARDAAVAQGITINGLPVMAENWDFTDGLEHLDRYYDNCVIGGPGAFTIAVKSWDEYPAALRRKFLLEIANKRAPKIRQPLVLVGAARSVDCLIGERRYRDNPNIHMFSPENFQWPANRPQN